MVGSPNFFLVGAAKSATTTLYEALRAHDDVFLPDVKEPHCYAYRADPTSARRMYGSEREARQRYAELYAPADDEVAVGDASTTNLVVPGAAAMIAADVPAARIVAVLRQPVDRAFSHFSHFVAAGGEDLDDFAEAVRREDARQALGYPFTYRYLGWGRYADQLAPFVERFGRDRVLVHLFDDLCADGVAVVRSTWRFLGVDGEQPVTLGRHNARSSIAGPPAREPPPRGWRARRYQGMARTGSRGWSAAQGARPLPHLDPAVRAELTEALEREIGQLEDLLGRDLSRWRAPEPASPPTPSQPSRGEPG